jgi:hypothetical protein
VKQNWVGLACLALLAGCDAGDAGDGAGGNGSANAAAAAGDKGLPRAGRYELTIVREDLGSTEPGQMETLQAPRCIAEGGSGPEQIIKEGVGPDCDAQALTLAGGRITMVASCRDPGGGPPLTIEGRGTYSPDGWQTVTDLALGGSRGRETQTARRTGDC